MIKSVLRKEDVIVILLEGNLDIGNKTNLKEELVKKIPGDTSNVILDLMEVSFIDSACLGALVGLARLLRKNKGDLRLCSLPEEVLSIFQITRLDKVFEIYETSKDAIASYDS